MKLQNIEFSGNCLPKGKVLAISFKGNDNCIYKASVQIPPECGVNTLIHRLSVLTENLWKLYFAHKANKENWK